MTLELAMNVSVLINKRNDYEHKIYMFDKADSGDCVIYKDLKCIATTTLCTDDIEALKDYWNTEIARIDKEISEL